MILAWMLPTGGGSYTLWCPATLKMGEVATDRVTVMSPFPIGDTEYLARLIHDHLFRYQMRAGLPKRPSTNFWFRTVWGLLYLIGMDDVREDLICGLYLLAGLPMLVNAVEALWNKHAGDVKANFDTATYLAEPEIVLCPRLANLAEIIDEEGRTTALHRLVELGLPELLGFYRRTAWSRRWTTPPPIGMGTFKMDKEVLLCSRI